MGGGSAKRDKRQAGKLQPSCIAVYLFSWLFRLDPPNTQGKTRSPPQPRTARRGELVDSWVLESGFSLRQGEKLEEGRMAVWELSEHPVPVPGKGDVVPARRNKTGKFAKQRERPLVEAATTTRCAAVDVSFRPLRWLGWAALCQRAGSGSCRWHQ